MSTPGFTAENSLYKGTAYYYTVAAVAQAQVEILQEFSSPAPPEIGAPGFPLPASRFRGGTSCDPVCHLDDTGACVRDCVSCPGGVPDGCQDFTKPCPSSACCPPGQDGCYAAHKAQFCCPPGLTCCHPETNLCCREQCCFDHCCGANENCCTLPGPRWVVVRLIRFVPSRVAATRPKLVEPSAVRADNYVVVAFAKTRIRIR